MGSGPGWQGHNSVALPKRAVEYKLIEVYNISMEQNDKEKHTRV
jgi:hypothetical protein